MGSEAPNPNSAGTGVTTAGEHVGGQDGAPYNEAASDASGPVLSGDNLQRWRLLSLAAIMVAVIVLAAGVSLAMLYRAELDSNPNCCTNWP